MTSRAERPERYRFSWLRKSGVAPAVAGLPHALQKNHFPLRSVGSVRKSYPSVYSQHPGRELVSKLRSGDEDAIRSSCNDWFTHGRQKCLPHLVSAKISACMSGRIRQQPDSAKPQRNRCSRSHVARPKSRNSWYIPAFSVHKLSDVLHKMSVGHFKKMWYIYFTSIPWGLKKSIPPPFPHRFIGLFRDLKGGLKSAFADAYDRKA